MADKWPIFGESKLIWFPIVNGIEDKVVSVLVVRENFDYVRHKAVPGSAFYLDDDVKGICDIRFDRAVRHLDGALQHARRKTRNALSSRIGMDRRDCAAVSCVEELQQVEGFAASNLA